MKKTGLIVLSLLMVGCKFKAPTGLSDSGDKPSKQQSQPRQTQVDAQRVSNRASLGSWADKLKAHQKNVQTNPQNYSSYVALGEMYTEMGKEQQAADAYENALLIKPKQTDVQLKLAKLYGDLGKSGQALNIYKTLMPVHENPYELKNDMANVLRKKKDYSAATKLVQEVLIEQKNNVDAVNTLGLIYYDQGKYELAALTLQKMIKAKIDNATTHNNLGLVYRKLDSNTESVDEWKAAAQMDKKLTEPRMNLAQLYMENGNYGDASVLYSEVLEENPVQIAARQNLGIALMSSKNIEEAEKMFLSILQFDPFNAESSFHLGLLYHYYMQDGEKAVQYYQRFIGQMKDKLPANHVVFNNLAAAKKLPPKNPPQAPETAKDAKATAPAKAVKGATKGDKNEKKQ